MAFIRIRIHCVWGTKNRTPFLFNNNKIDIIRHIKENANTKNIYVDFINGDKEHIQCLISIGADQTISKIMQMIKGESSHWINNSSIIKGKFEWADEYFATSADEYNLNIVRDYI
jgi:putative transposase